MSGSAEEVKKHIAVYWKVFGGLMVLTTLTVAVSYLSVAVLERPSERRLDSGTLEGGQCQDRPSPDG